MSTMHGMGAVEALTGCTCTDPGVDQLRDLITAGVDQHTASHALWGDPTYPGAARHWVRHQYASRFPWLALPPLETP